jgi:GMP synthase-like glutamine amidotransferase
MSKIRSMGKYKIPQKKETLTIAVDEGFSGSYGKYLGQLADKVNFIPFKDLIKGGTTAKIDLLLFTGGADVDPLMYGENKGQHTGINKKRDQAESTIFEDYWGIPKLGICRGSQLLTVLSGGKLIQHVESHAMNMNHKLTFRDSDNFNNQKDYLTTSTHHQMMFPFNLGKRDYDLLAWSTKHLSNVYLNGENKQKELPSDFLEPEIVYYKGTNSLAIQGHPEFSNADEYFVQLTIKLITKYLL